MPEGGVGRGGRKREGHTRRGLEERLARHGEGGFGRTGVVEGDATESGGGERRGCEVRPTGRRLFVAGRPGFLMGF